MILFHCCCILLYCVKVADTLADAFLRGIIAGDIRNTSVTAMFPYLKAADNEYGGVSRYMRKIKTQNHGKVPDGVPSIDVRMLSIVVCCCRSLFL